MIHAVFEVNQIVVAKAPALKVDNRTRSACSSTFRCRIRLILAPFDLACLQTMRTSPNWEFQEHLLSKQAHISLPDEQHISSNLIAPSSKITHMTPINHRSIWAKKWVKRKTRRGDMVERSFWWTFPPLLNPYLLTISWQIPRWQVWRHSLR